jgi:hypothetical protein
LESARRKRPDFLIDSPPPIPEPRTSPHQVRHLGETMATNDQCDRCKGTGDCRECDGKKKTPSGHRCPDCEGDGECDKCNGTGKVQ